MKQLVHLLPEGSYSLERYDSGWKLSYRDMVAYGPDIEDVVSEMLKMLIRERSR